VADEERVDIDVGLDEIDAALRRREKRRKDEETVKVVEEVFDYRTLLALHKLLSRGVISRLYGAVASGKEARIHLGVTPSGEYVAVKIFLVATAEFRRGRLKYILGDPRFRRVKRDIRSIVKAWCYKEYRNLSRAYSAGVTTPKPHAAYENILVMEFIDAGEPGVPAPTLKEVLPEEPEQLYQQLKEEIRKTYQAGLVHADLSEYNILYKSGKGVLIDWGSAVLTSHPHAHEFLLHDIRTVFRYFRKLGVDTEDPLEFYRQLAQEK